jgi:ParB/RepB/Spo0J family partition protein
LTEVADAVGITGNGGGRRRRTSIVEQLVSSPAGELLHLIPLTQLRENPDNPRRSILDVDELADSIRAHGIVQALVVVPAAVYAGVVGDGYVIVAGHRRFHGAEKAGLAAVPAQVREDLDRTTAHEVMLIENLHREDLTKFEEARGYAQLAGEPHNLSQRQVADRVGVNQSHVSRMLAISSLPDKAQQAVRAGEVTIQDAAALAAVSEQPEVFDTAWQRVTQHRWSAKEALREAAREQVAAVKVREATEKLTARGITIVADRPRYYVYGGESGKPPVTLEALEQQTREHAKLDCHAAYVEGDGKVVYVCTKPTTHMSTQKRSGSSAEAKERATRKELKEAAAARTTLLRAALGGRGLSAKARTEILQRGLVNAVDRPYAMTSGDGHAITLDILGLSPTDKKAYPRHVLAELIEGRKVSVDRLTAAIALAFIEEPLRDPHRKSWDEDATWYLEWLETEHGHDLSVIEHTRLGHKRSKDGVWSRPKATS